MLRNYFLTTFRNLRRHPGYAFINVFGLALGIACCLLIIAFVKHEISYDQYHVDADQIVRAQRTEQMNLTSRALAPHLIRSFEEIEAAVRVWNVGSFRPIEVKYGDRVFQESGFIYADSTVFDVLSIPLLRGEAETALNRRNTLVFSESVALKYFRDEDPIGKLVDLGQDELFEVTAIMKEIPGATHLPVDIIASFASTEWAASERWTDANFFTYLRLSSSSDVNVFAVKVRSELDRLRQVSTNVPEDMLMVPITDIHLLLDGRITYVYLFSAIALLILLVAGINYMNLATARSAMRAREVGVRKTVGAQRNQLITQFYSESIVLSLSAGALSIVMIEMLEPLFVAISDSGIDIRILGDTMMLTTIVGICLFVGLVAGSYPALLLSAFRPAIVLKGKRITPSGQSRLRQGMVIFQFSVSIILLVGTAVVVSQLNFVQSRNLGFDQDNVIVLDMNSLQNRQGYPGLKQAFLDDPGVLSVSRINSIPGYQRSGYGLTADGIEISTSARFFIVGVRSGHDAVETLGLEVIAGEAFPQSAPDNPENGEYLYLVNESLLRHLDWTPDEAIGKSIAVSDSRTGRVIGVIRDYHYRSLHEPIGPMVYFMETRYAGKLLARISAGGQTETLERLKSIWTRFSGSELFEAAFIDQQVDALYREDRQIGRLMSVFASLAIVIACLGLFGLAAFSAQQRTKEIGIRKVFGASVPRIAGQFVKDFLVLVVLAFLISAPIAYIILGRWLESFAYRINIGPGIMIVSGLTAVAVAFLTVGYQAIRAALKNPIDSLRYE